MAQKQGRQGSKGGWKEFLKVYDPKFGSSLSDPARRPREALLSFLNTFTEPEHLKVINSSFKEMLLLDITSYQDCDHHFRFVCVASLLLIFFVHIQIVR